MDYVIFLEITYTKGEKFSMYVDHFGDELKEWFDEDKSEIESVEENNSRIHAKGDKEKDEYILSITV